MAASIQESINVQPPSNQSKTGSRFLDLPPEIRNRIYSMLFSIITANVETEVVQPGNKFKLCYKTCTASSNDHSVITGLTGAAHAHAAESGEDSSNTTDYAKWKACGSNPIFVTENSCHQPTRLSTQLLRTCRSIHNEAALLPYATNAFRFRGGLPSEFRAAFRYRFGLEKRRAIQTVIVSAHSLENVAVLREVFPGLQRLCLTDRPIMRDYRRLESDYARVKLPSLVGAAAQLAKHEEGADWKSGELELALLDNEAHEEHEKDNGYEAIFSNADY